MTQNAQLFAGDVYVSFEVSDGVFGPATRIRTDLLSITTPSDKKQKISKGREDYGQAHASAILPKPTEFAITFTEMTRALLAVQLSGKIDVITSAGGTFADIPITAALDAWVDIGRKDIAAAGFVVKNSTGTVTYEEGVHYEVNRRLGKLRAIPLASGGIEDAAALKLTGSSAATTGTRITGATKFRHVLKIEGDVVNLLTNKDSELFAGRAVVTSDQAFDFLQSDIADLKLKGTLEVPTGGGAPFTVEERTVA